MPIQWKTGAEKTVVDVRVGGPGNPWALLDIDAGVDAAKGGGRAVTSKWGRGEKGGLLAKGFFYTANPNRFTFNAMLRFKSQNFLQSLDCPFDVRVRQRCDRPDTLIAYSDPGIVGFLEGINTDSSFSDPLAHMDGVDADIKSQYAVSATLKQNYAPLAHDDKSGTTDDVQFNKIIAPGITRCAGDCGVQTDEADTYWWVTNRDSTPTYAGNATPSFYYTTDKLQTKTKVQIDLFQGADATDVLAAGQYVLVFSPDKAPAYAKYSDILNGVTPPNLWFASTGFAGITAGNFPRAAAAVNSSLIYAVGAGGRVWKTTDGGASFTLIDNGTLTAQNLTTIAAQSDETVYIGGNSGVLIRIFKGSESLVTVRDSSGNILSSNINVVATPDTRSNEVHIGTAGGEIWYSKTATDTRPVFTNANLPRKGTGSVKDIRFAGYRGDVAFVIQNDTNGNSRILRDLSGGTYQLDQVEAVGDFQTPGNFGFNSIAPANVNYAGVVGNLHNGYGYIGLVRSND